MKQLSALLYFLFFYVLILGPSISSAEIHSNTGLAILPAKTLEKFKQKFPHYSRHFQAGRNISDSLQEFPLEQRSLENFSLLLHKMTGTCSGFSYREGNQNYQTLLGHTFLNKIQFQDSIEYTIKNRDLVFSFLPELKEQNLLATMAKLSSFHNRYYKSQHGVKSMQWIKSSWESFAANRTDVSISFFNHSWPQPSVIAEIKGRKEERIVIGAHGDSISWSYLSPMAIRNRAPGVDDNASGTSVVTEVFRALVEKNYKPENTLVFIIYAAEEVGLRGSQDIVKDFVRRKVPVKGVLQLDMTAFTSSRERPKISLIDDFTHPAQNAFLGRLLDEYVKIEWVYNSCGYPCSDHASWTEAKIAASMPFSTPFSEYNRHIHTSGDTLDKVFNSASHAFKFAKLALSYIIELDHAQKQKK